LIHLQGPSYSKTGIIGEERLRQLSWVAGSLAVLEGLLLAALLLWGVVTRSIDLPKVKGPSWLQDTSLPAILSTATPTPVPTPTLTPDQVAAQFVPQLQDALTNENWERALEIVAIISAVDPGGEKVREWALTTSMRYGQALVVLDQFADALDQFSKAVILAPDDAEARLWQQTTQLYLAGQEAFEAGQWEAAIQSFTLAQEQIPSYADLPSRLVDTYRQQAKAAMADGNWTVAIEALSQAHEQLPNDEAVVDMLASAYGQRGIARQDRGTLSQGRVNPSKLEQAQSDLEAALALRPNDAQAKAHLNQVKYLLHPPKRIEVDISEQRLYAWQGDQLVYEYPVSTGLPGQDTATGHYRILDKIPMAYSRIWKLSMPYWMGIYYVQGIENGFHALPIRPDGSVMWAGLLGRRASYGCIVLGTQAAQTLYNWAEIGTRVDIHY
jgi:tetratricopeptide (TPR) repeat protein